MLLKVSLIVAILASIATLVISHLQISGKVTELQANLKDTQSNLQVARQDAEKSKKDAKKAKDEAEKTNKELAETQTKLESATSNWNTQQERADKFEAQYKKTSADFLHADRDLAAWKALGIPVEQVQNRLTELEKAKKAIDALDGEKQVMMRNIDSLKRQLAPFLQVAETPPVPPPGLKAKVVAVNPKWDFVVINVGSNQGLEARSELLVSRGGKLVAKLRVTSVESERSFANVLPEWKQADVLEGDTVMD